MSQFLKKSMWYGKNIMSGGIANAKYWTLIDFDKDTKRILLDSV